MTTVYKAKASEVPGVLQVLEREGLHPVAHEETSFPLPWVLQKFYDIEVAESEVRPAAEVLREHESTRPAVPRPRLSRRGKVWRWVTVLGFVAGICCTASGYPSFGPTLAMLSFLAFLIVLKWVR